MSQVPTRTAAQAHGCYWKQQQLRPTAAPSELKRHYFSPTSEWAGDVTSLLWTALSPCLRQLSEPAPVSPLIRGQQSERLTAVSSSANVSEHTGADRGRLE